MNKTRLVLAGLAAGLVMAILDGITNAVLFGPTWTEAYRALGLAPSQGAIAGFWISFDFVNGIIIVWLYAAMSPRFGAGAPSAIRAGLVQWLILHYTLASHYVDGVFPAKALAGTAACELVAALAGAAVGARLYREP